MNMSRLETHIYEGFLEAVYFANSEACSTIAPWDDALLRDLIARFVAGNSGALEVLERYDYLSVDIGRLLYYTLAGHGAGFWEYDHYKILQSWIDTHYTGSQIDIYTGDDGLTYIDGL